MLKVFVVDDECKSRELTKMFLLEVCEEVDIVGMAESVQESIPRIKMVNPDLLLLDIELGMETGFDLLTSVHNEQMHVIFITAHANYALKAFNFSAVDYLLKPLNPEELRKAVLKVQQRHKQTVFQNKFMSLIDGIHSNGQSKRKIALPTSEGLLFVPVDEIIYCEASGAYTSLCIQDNRKILVSKNLKEYEMMLRGSNFFRVHNSFLVNLNHIIKYVKGDGGYVIMSNNVSIDVSKRRKEAFLEVITLK